MIDVQSTFVPFMVGSISLIAFLSVRNFYLAGAARKLADELPKMSNPLMCQSAIIQINWLVTRYKVSNTALLLAIGAVVCFGGMIASFAMNSKTWTRDVALELPSVAMICGGLLATIATAMSVYETYVARRSLMTAVATALICSKQNITQAALKSELIDIASAVRGSIRSDLHGMLLEIVHTPLATSATATNLGPLGSQRDEKLTPF